MPDANSESLGKQTNIRPTEATGAILMQCNLSFTICGFLAILEISRGCSNFWPNRGDKGVGENLWTVYQETVSVTLRQRDKGESYLSIGDLPNIYCDSEGRNIVRVISLNFSQE